jgi:hypothetical protein
MIRTLLLAGASALAFATAAEATTFDYTGTFQLWTAPAAGTYQVDVWGAQGGNAGAYTGGLGAGVGDSTYLPAGFNVLVLVGGQGLSGPTSGGGGGGSGVYATGAGFGIFVGGGGGASAYASPFANGGNGQPVAPGGAAGDGYAPFGPLVPGGAFGMGGEGGYGGGGGGYGPGYNGFGTHPGDGGAGSFAFNDGLGYGGANGGFGASQGGGGGLYSGGGGGGVSGGGGGVYAGGGGGGSYDFLSPDGAALAYRSGNGEITIDPVPEPSTWSLLLGGFGLLGYALRRRFLRAA